MSTVFEDNQKNVVSFAKKFILDSMVKTEKLQDDNKNYVKGFKDTFEYGKTTKVIVEIEEEL